MTILWPAVSVAPLLCMLGLANEGVILMEQEVIGGYIILYYLLIILLLLVILVGKIRG